MNLRPLEAANPYWAGAILVSNNVIKNLIHDWLFMTKSMDHNYPLMLNCPILSVWSANHSDGLYYQSTSARLVPKCASIFLAGYWLIGNSVRQQINMSLFG
jgi:hypothetical protein